jgi:hypothetical protein
MADMTTEGEPLTIPEAQRRLGFKGDPQGRRLLRLLIAKERSAGARFLIRQGGGQRQRFKVTMTAIRRHAPDLLPSKVDKLRRDFSGYMKAIDDRIAEGAAQHVQRFVEPRLSELYDRDEEIAESVDELAQRVAKLSGADV